MSVPVRNPTFIQGSPRASGDVQTGELQHVRGGGRAATFYSGAVAPGLTCAPGSVAVGSDVLLFSGAGRLNSVLQLIQMVSGVPVYFYDSAVPVSGGPIYASGHKQIGLLPPTFAGGLVSGNNPTLFTGQPINVDIPFQSGLCFNSRSGQPPFTVTWTPEISTAFPGP